MKLLARRPSAPHLARDGRGAHIRSNTVWSERMRTIVLGLCLLALAGCVTARNTIQATDSEGRRAFLRYAGADGPVYLIAANPPAELGGHDAVAGAVAGAASGAVFAMDTQFTATISEAKHSNFRIVALFDPVDAMSTEDVCKSEAAGANVPAARHGDRTNLFLAFCTRGESIAGTRVSGPKVTALSDPAFAEMARTGIREMFAIDDRDRERGKPPILGSVSTYPNLGFRLNPLTGIVD